MLTRNGILGDGDERLVVDLTNITQINKLFFAETLRLYPSLPLVPRVCTKDYPVPGTDFVLKPGTGVIISIMGIHRDPDLWPNPHAFDPERFTLKNREKIVPYSWIPFGEGPRICVGKLLAYYLKSKFYFLFFSSSIWSDSIQVGNNDGY